MEVDYAEEAEREPEFKTLCNGHEVPRALSYSSISKFDRCPLRYFFRYVAGKSELESRPARIGIKAHECMEEYYNYCIENDIPKDPDKMKEIVMSVDLPADEWNELKGLVMPQAKYNELDLPYNNPKVEEALALDTNLDKTDWNDDDAVLRGKIDFKHWTKDNNLIIEDFKTNRKVPSQSDIENSLQLKLYAWMHSKVHPNVDYFQIRLNFLRYDTVLSQVITQQDLPEIEDEIMRLFDRIVEAEREKDFPARVCSDCSWCDYRKKCPEYQSASDELNLDHINIDDHEDARELAEKMKMHKKVASDIDEELRAYVENTGRPIEVSDEELTWHPTKRTYWPRPKELFLALTDMGLSVDEAWDCFGVGKQDLKKKLREHGFGGKLDELQDKIGEETKKTYWQFRKQND